ncbi:MAG: hypothetical protein LLF83_01385 [Methanobacterium sp.]|nr:hypothetical protein [Methanobacterium sp.]
MLDFGIVTEDKTEDYYTKLLNELVPGDEITGELIIGDFKTSPMDKREVAEFYIIISDHKNHQKWVAEITTPYFPETGNVYAEKDGLFYSLIDSLNHVVNGTPRKWQDNYSVNFHQLRKTVNSYLTMLTVKAVQPVNTDAKHVNLEIIDADYKTGEKKPKKITIYDLAQEDPIILMGYSQLRNKGDRITVKNIVFELKSLMDDEKITEEAYQKAFKKLKSVDEH